MKVPKQIPKEGQHNVKRRSDQISVNGRRSKEGQKKVPATKEGFRKRKKAKRRSEEGPDNRRMSIEGQKKVLIMLKEGPRNRNMSKECQNNVKRRSRQ